MSSHREELEWARSHMPVLVEYSTDGSDDWVRDVIRGEATRRVVAQRVIVQGLTEAERVLHALWRKSSRIGGATLRRFDYQPPTVIRSTIRSSVGPARAVRSTRGVRMSRGQRPPKPAVLEYLWKHQELLKLPDLELARALKKAGLFSKNMYVLDIQISDIRKAIADEDR